MQQGCLSQEGIYFFSKPAALKSSWSDDYANVRKDILFLSGLVDQWLEQSTHGMKVEDLPPIGDLCCMPVLVHLSIFSHRQQACVLTDDWKWSLDERVNSCLFVSMSQLWWTGGWSRVDPTSCPMTTRVTSKPSLCLWEETKCKDNFYIP